MPIPLGILAVAGAGGAAASAYDLLETTLISTNTASVTFSSLGAYSDYKHLQIRTTARTTRALQADGMTIRLNSDSGSNYRAHRLQGNGTAVESSDSGSVTFIRDLPQIAGDTATANIFGAMVIDILDFSNANKNTTTRALGGSHTVTFNAISLSSGLWNNTNAVTSITIAPLTGPNFVAGSRFSLYGVK
jgi:hypothetical protein